MNRPPDQRRRQAWSRYWASGSSHSCPGSFDERYAGAVSAFWHPLIQALPADGRVLDACCGNGPIARMVVEQRPDCRVDAVDLAAPQPAWIADLAEADSGRVRFHGGVDVAGLPFPDACFDLVCSQFGLEYSDLDSALPEVRRVLATRGCLALVAHHAGSVLAQVAADEAGHLAWLLGASGLFDAADAMVDWMAQASTPAGAAALTSNARANADRARLNGVLAALSERARVQSTPDVLHETARSVLGVLDTARGAGAGSARAELQSLGDALADGRLRVDELVAHALDAEAVAGLAAWAQGVGWRCDAGELRDGGRLLGWTLRFRARD
ncbi:MAG: class I SAM-dependent methyltransferase [Lysobacteraceae bacterium]